MSFNKRFLSTDSIKRFANSNQFESFQVYMTHADAYIINGEFASKFYKEFGSADSNSEERKNLYNKIKNDEYQ